jgi:hypothetical protein
LGGGGIGDAAFPRDISSPWEDAVSRATAAGNIDAPIAPVALINILRETLAMILRRNYRLLAGGKLPEKNSDSLLMSP